MTTDAELLLAYAGSRSETAFAGFVERRVGFVYATALRETGGDAHLSQDVAQAVFSLAAKKAGALAGHGRLAGWLYTTTTHIARRERRNARTRARYEQEAAAMNALQHNDHASDDPGAGGFEKLRPLLNTALDTLRADERESVLLRFFEGRTFGEIGAQLKMSEDAARMRVARAIEKMRAAFARRGVTSSAAALGALLAAEAAAQTAPAGLAAAVSSGAISAAGAGALASASAAAANVLIFMTTTKTMTITAAVAALAIGGAFYGAFSERAAEKSLADAKRQNDLLLSRSRAAGQQKEASQARANGPTTNWPDEYARGAKFIDEHPAVRQAFDAYGKANTARRFYRLRGELGLTDAQWQEFLRIMGSTPGNISAWGFTNLHTGGGVYVQWPKAVENNQEELRAFLGDAGLARVQEEKKYNGEALSGAVATALYFTDTPLSSAQALQLDELVARWDSESKTSIRGRDDNAWNAFLSEASGFLSESQIEAMNNQRSIAAWNAEQEKCRAMLKEKQRETEASGGKTHEQ